MSHDDEQIPPGWTVTPTGYLVPDDLDDDPRLWTGEPMDGDEPTDDDGERPSPRPAHTCGTYGPNHCVAPGDHAPGVQP